MTPRINWKPSSKEIRQFGTVILIGFGIIGSIFFFQGKKPVALWLWGITGFIFILSYAFPSLAKPFYWLWMGLGFLIGSVMSRLILLIIFFFVLTPVALVFKLMGRDALNRRKHESSSYWVEHPPIKDKSYYDHLF